MLKLPSAIVKRILPTIYLVIASLHCVSQSGSLNQAVETNSGDTNEVYKLLKSSKDLISSSPKEAIDFSFLAMQLAQKIKFKTGEALALKNIGMVYYNQTKYIEAFENWNHSYLIFDSIGDLVNTSLMLNNLGSIYMNQGDNAKALEYYFKSLRIAEQGDIKQNLAIVLGNIGTIYSNNKFTYDKALFYYLKALPISEKLNDHNIIGGILVNIGDTYSNRNESDSALQYYKRSLVEYANTENIPYSLNAIGGTYNKQGKYYLAKKYHDSALAFATRFDLQLDIAQSLNGLGETYYEMGDYKNALEANKEALSRANARGLKKVLQSAYEDLSLVYVKLHDFKNAYYYHSLYSNIKDTLLNIDIAQKINTLQNNLEIQRKESQIDLLTKNRKLQDLEYKRQIFRRNSLAVGLILVFVVALILFNLYRKIVQRTIQLNKSLEELKSTQAQLIQSEKMASLGELIAGIAHEIQNPLNFVNNFSELNRELIEDMKFEIDKGNIIEAKSIADDINMNEEKIMHHGKRADSIVKSMFQHSSNSTGQKELKDINALVNEYLMLSYHSFRAKDKSFRATIKTDFSETIPMINIIPQDIGRALFNLFNNAFYSVNEKARTAGENYEPEISLGSNMSGKSVEIRVRDNGMGISQNVVDKIYQPFFTTKPTGQGSGLGLSLSYDIIYKEHGGKMRIETREGEFAEFFIELPLQ